MELSRRLPSHCLGSSVPGGSSMVVLGDSEQGGSRSFPSSAGLELLLGRFRRRLGCHNRRTSSVRSLDSKPKGTLHQPQRDDGSTEWPLAVQLAPQRQDDRPVLQQCHDSRVSQAIRRHEVSGSCSSKRGRSSCGSNLCRSRSSLSSSRGLSTRERIFSVGPTW